MSAAGALRSARLRLLPPDAGMAAPLADYYARNGTHLAPWEPRRAHLSDAAVQARHLAVMAQDHADDRHWRWFLVPHDDARIVGSVALSGVARGFHHSANLGYSVDVALQGRGLMREALEAVLGAAFGPALNLHRVQAGCVPHNARSISLLQRLGFREIGLAQGYLCIDGRWQDHRLFERLNPGFRAPGDWGPAPPA